MLAVLSSGQGEEVERRSGGIGNGSSVAVDAIADSTRTYRGSCIEDSFFIFESNKEGRVVICV